MTQNDIDTLLENSKGIWNSKVWRVAVNVQHRFEEGYEPSDMDALRLDFRYLLAIPTVRKKHRQIGSLWIDVNTCGIRLERAGEVLVASGDSSEKVLARFKQLVGKTLVSVNIDAPSGDTDFVLEDDLVLRCFRATAGDGGGWGISLAENN